MTTSTCKRFSHSEKFAGHEAEKEVTRDLCGVTCANITPSKRVIVARTKHSSTKQASAPEESTATQAP